MGRIIRARPVAIALITMVITAGVVFAVDQFTREVSASVNVKLLTDSGIEFYLEFESMRRRECGHEQP